MTTIKIQSYYEAYSETSVELPSGKTWDDAEDWGIKWSTLYVTWTDGTETEHELNEPDVDDFDLKRPSYTDVTEED